MNSIIMFSIFVCVIAVLFLVINWVFAPHNPYQEKDSMFECGYHSFLQSRSPFSIAFFIFALVYLLLDLEVLLSYPFSVSEYVNGLYGLIIIVGFILIISIGFVYELGKGALKILSKQFTSVRKNIPETHISYIRNKPEYVTLKSSVFPFTIIIKKFVKYLTLKNIITGLITLTIVALVKALGIPTFILNIFCLEVQEFAVFMEYIIAGIFGLIARLGIKGLVEWFFEDHYATMGGKDPVEVNDSNRLDVWTSEKRSDDGSEKGNGSDDEKGNESDSGTDSDSYSRKGKGVDKGKGIDKGKGVDRRTSEELSDVENKMDTSDLENSDF